MEIQKAQEFAEDYAAVWDETREQINDLTALIRARDKAIIERCKEITVDNIGMDGRISVSEVFTLCDSVLRELE